MNKKRKIVLAVSAAFILLLVFNPGATAFKYYLGYEDVRHFRGEDIIRKKYNFFVASVYEYDGRFYIGILLNFIRL